MSRVDDYLELVDNPSRRALDPGHSADNALLALLVHVAFSDAKVEKNELAFLAKALPGRTDAELLSWVEREAGNQLNWEALKDALPTIEERLKGLRFACRMAWKDGTIQPEEQVLLDEMASQLDLGPSAVSRVLFEMQGYAKGTVSMDKLVDSIQGLQWDTVQVAGGELESDLRHVVPEGLELVARFGVEQVEVAAVFEEGLAANFLEGSNFVAWSELVAYTRVSTLGASLQLHTESGRTWTLVDTRMRGLSLLLDRLFGQKRKESSSVVVSQVRGMDADD